MRSARWLSLALLAACGGSSPSGLGDGGRTGPDGLAGDPVEMLVTLDGAAVSGAEVYFVDATGHLVGTETTGADGVAHAVMADGGSVTVVEPDPEDADEDLDSFLAVKSGDHLVDALVDQLARSGDDSITFDVTIPADPNANVATYEFDSTCGSVDISDGADGSPQSVTLAGCANGTADIVIATRDSSRVLLDTIALADQAVADQTPLAVDGPYVAATAHAVSVAHVTGAADATVTRYLVTTNGLVDESGAEDGGPDSATFALAGGAGSGVIASPGLAAAREIFAGAYAFSDTETAESTAWRAPGGAFAYDGASELLPRVATAPAYDVAANAIATSFSATGAGATPDVAISVTSFDRAATATDSEHTWKWTVIAPGTDAASVAFPTLPTDLVDFRGTATDTVDAQRLTTQTFPGGYAAFHLDPFGAGLDYAQLAQASATGSVQVDAYAELQTNIRRRAGVSSRDALLTGLAHVGSRPRLRVR